MLTPKQKQIFEYIKRYIKENNYSPSLEEIGQRFKLVKSTIHQHVKALRQKGYLEKIDNQPRSIKISKKKNSLGLMSIPLLGAIAAGQPIEAIENKETIEIQKNLLSKSGENFALRVQGDSMIDEGIYDGSIVVVKKQPTVENGEIAVALINGNEVTLKKVYKERGGFRLQPANPNVKPIFTKELIIQGKVITVIRNFEQLKKTIKNKWEFNDYTVKYMEEADINYRKSLGQYFTPRSIRELLVNKLPNTIKRPKVLDPACGTGEFLVTAKNYFKDPDLYGFDIDEGLITIAKKVISEAKFKKIDSLSDRNYGKYDFVIGNPPYFEFSPSEEIKTKFKHITNGRINIFSLFICQGLSWLKDGGHLAFVVPPSMNNGAYFLKLRKFIIENANIEYLHILKDPKIFHGALQSTMLIVLKKGKNRGNYLFKNNGILIFSEEAKFLEKSFKNKITLYDLGYEVKTGRLIWNENKHLLTNNSKEGIPLIWAHNVTDKGLKHPLLNSGKPQYVKRSDFDIGPAIVTNRITGSVKSKNLKAAIIPAGKKFIAENHVNVIFPRSAKKQIKLTFNNSSFKKSISLYQIAKQLSSKENLKIIENITGNTQISKTELENLFPIKFVGI